MQWREVASRMGARIAVARRQVTRRRAFVSLAVLFVAATTAVSTEAFFRARLGDPGARMPTALYSRTVPWGAHAGRVTPVAIGTVDGAPQEERIPVPIGEIPDRLLQAVMAVEDQRFYVHHGVDIKRIAGAFVANVKARGIVQGGSTLTQQLAKNLFLSADRTPLRKVREAALSMMLELRYDKATIFNAYLNEIYLGQDGARAIHGVGAASRYYLGKDVRKVTLAEAAQLAAMISAPNRTEPSRHPDAARDRRNLVLQLLLDQRRISETSVENARDVDITAGTHTQSSLDGRYFRDYAMTRVTASLPKRGMAVYTTLDASLQRNAERAVAAGLDRLGNGGAEAALVAIDPRTGEILAMVGGHDYGATQFNRAVDAHRQPGSAFKPIVALAALQREKGNAPAFTLASVVEDEPLRVETGGTAWEPVDYDQSYRGQVTLREAMEQSLNIPFARVGMAIGPDRIVAMARQVGITSPLAKVPSLALGSSDVTLLELARAYGVLATSGSLATTRVIVGHGKFGQPIAGDGSVQRAVVVDPAVAYLVTSALQGVVTRGTGRSLNQDERFGGIAGKTGTTSNYRDAWFMTYSPTLVVGVWVGYDDGRSVELTGAAAALPIAAAFLRAATPENGWPDFDVPPGISEGYVNAADGDVIGDCSAKEVFLQGTEPSGGGCDSFELPDWHSTKDWGAALGRKAVRLLQQLIRGRVDERVFRNHSLQ